MRQVDPFQIVRRRGQFQVRDGNNVLSTHRDYLYAEDAALRHWLGPQRKKGQYKGFEANELQTNIFESGAD